MLNTMWAVVREGKIAPLEKVELPEGRKLLVTIMPYNEDVQFWLQASQVSLDTIWDNNEDDVYAELLEG